MDNYIKIKQFAPVVIPTLNRFEHFKRCLESLERCTGADKTDVYVGLDYPPSEKYVGGWKMIDVYLREKEKSNGFKNLYVRRRDHNCGVCKEDSNGSLLLQEVEKVSDRYIFSEDDNEFSPNFLEYMNKCLEKYKEDRNIIKVSAYNSPVMKCASEMNCFCNIDSPAYGTGGWFSKKISTDYVLIQKELTKSATRLWNLFWTYPAIVHKAIRMIEKKQNYGDICWSMHNLLYGTFTLCPTVSMVRNWGCDGSGVHSGVVVGKDLEEIQISTHFDLDNIEICLLKCTRKALRHRNMPRNRVLYYIFLMYYMFNAYIYYFRKEQ